MNTIAADPRVQNGMRAQLAKRKTLLDAGARTVGWKVGFGAPAILERLKLAAPLVGFLTDRALVPSGGTVSVAGWVKPVAEPEIAIHIGNDVPGGADRETARAAVAALGPAIELVDFEAPPDDVEATLAGNIFQRHVVLGPRSTAMAGVNLVAAKGRVIRSGKAVEVPADLESNIGSLVTTVQNVANALAAFGETLRAGQFIIGGSVVPPFFLEAGDTGVIWTLDPAGTVEVTFAH